MSRLANDADSRKECGLLLAIAPIALEMLHLRVGVLRVSPRTYGSVSTCGLPPGLVGSKRLLVAAGLRAAIASQSFGSGGTGGGASGKVASTSRLCTDETSLPALLRLRCVILVCSELEVTDVPDVDSREPMGETDVLAVKLVDDDEPRFVGETASNAGDRWAAVAGDRGE